MEARQKNDGEMKSFSDLKAKYSIRWKTELAMVILVIVVFPILISKGYPASIGIKIAAMVAITAIMVLSGWYSIRFNRHMCKARDVNELLRLNREEGSRVLRYNKIAIVVACLTFAALHYKGTFGGEFLVDCIYYFILFAVLWVIENWRFKKDTARIMELL